MTIVDDILDRKWVSPKTLYLYILLVGGMEAQYYHTTWDNLVVATEWTREEVEECLKKMAYHDVIGIEETDGGLVIAIRKLSKSKKKGATKREAKSSVVPIEERKRRFGMTLQPYEGKYGREMLTDFYRYWSEPTPSGTKMRFELQRTWSVEGRLVTWARNNERRSKVGRSNSEMEQRGSVTKNILKRLIGQ